MPDIKLNRTGSVSAPEPAHERSRTFPTPVPLINIAASAASSPPSSPAPSSPSSHSSSGSFSSADSAPPQPVKAIARQDSYPSQAGDLEFLAYASDSCGVRLFSSFRLACFTSVSPPSRIAFFLSSTFVCYVFDVSSFLTRGVAGGRRCGFSSGTVRYGR